MLNFLHADCATFWMGVLSSRVAFEPAGKFADDEPLDGSAMYFGTGLCTIADSYMDRNSDVQPIA